jgi:hypothetical protein
MSRKHCVKHVRSPGRYKQRLEARGLRASHMTVYLESKAKSSAPGEAWARISPDNREAE